MSSKNKIALSLSKEEAIVIFEILSRAEDESELKAIDQAEQQALSNLLCLLEKKLEEPLCDNYNSILDDAKQALLTVDEEE